MNPAVPRHRSSRNGPRVWILRLLFGGTLVGLSIWGIALCHEVFRVALGPPSSPMDSNSANLGASVAWMLFFGPVAAAGVVTVWSTLRNLGALDQCASWLSRRADGLPVNIRQHAASVSGCESDDLRGLESLSAETVERLQRTAARSAAILGGLAGAASLGAGMFGLLYLSLFSQPYAGSSVYLALATSRLTITFALFSGISVLVGIAILQRTFRRENSSWLLLLRVFTYSILRQGRPGRAAKRTQAHRPDSKPQPQD